ncbi:MAG: serine hydrolase domain-containing protein [Terriglobales bacterium]
MTAETRLKADVTNDAPEVTPGLPLLAAFAITPSVHKTPLNLTLPSRESGFSFLVRNTTAQDERFHDAFVILENAIAARAFPACSLTVSFRGELVVHKALGRFTYDPASPEVSAASIFDLASLTKVVATTAMAMILYERGLLDLEAPVSAIVPDFAGALDNNDPRRREITLRMLLAHSSGLPAYEKLFLRAKTPEDLLQAAFITPLSAAPGTRAEYSDIGFIILGVALERLADESLDAFCQREIFGPLGMTHTTFNPANALKDSIPPTANDRTFRRRIIQGEVQDENASVLGGIAGHAGLFSAAEDLAIFAHAILNGGYPILRSATVELFSRRESAPEGTSRALGWDTPSLPMPSQSGKYFSPRSFGHLGYTGTSLWIDAECQLSITLLTNRTWPDCQNQAIKQVRPAFHDAVIETLRKNA